MSGAKVLSTKVITTLVKGSRSVQVGYVDSTDRWKRPFLSDTVRDKFTETTEGYIDTLRPDTKMVALQETPHQSAADNRTHFTAVELNGAGKVTSKRHFAVK
ncbi:hypothetical protein F503_08569 [Ophiostoma piceae UAMH 11346]|uniref:Uncharacterized protein n=1 Tax=Ophiostoma piceae (strain UAMH 11346) TaxID=1262450 RepID=S3BPG6_OPHP1|nr:hypothetical protein F503_08569 [Ophiostoma piceae UAMH 11346]